ncbi:hypothetical protein ACTPEF_24605, partial [Clostridioides difficile]
LNSDVSITYFPYLILLFLALPLLPIVASSIIFLFIGQISSRIKGISSIFLAKEFDATVFATDLWIEPTENYKRFKEFKLDDKIF